MSTSVMRLMPVKVTECTIFVMADVTMKYDSLNF